MENNYTVDENLMESALDDAAQAPETGGDALSEALEQIAPTTDVEAGQQEGTGELEMPADKGLRGRMKQFEQRGYNRGLKEAESKWAEKERGYQERLAKLDQMELENEAKKFAQENNVPENFALEYLRMKKGMPAAEQPRDDAGRFAPQKPAADNDPKMAEAQARAQTLMTQAEAFEKMSNGAVTKDAILEAFQSDADMHQKVVSGEWDFTDIGRALGDAPQRSAPRVSRSANNGKIGTSTFLTMSDEEFARFDRQISAGAIYDARR